MVPMARILVVGVVFIAAPSAFAELKPTRQPISANAAAETNFMLSPLCVSLRRPGEPVGRASPATQPDSNDNRLFTSADPNPERMQRATRTELFDAVDHSTTQIGNGQRAAHRAGIVRHVAGIAGSRNLRGHARVAKQIFQEELSPRVRELPRPVRQFLAAHCAE